jgi:hypothetical protein
MHLILRHGNKGEWNLIQAVGTDEDIDKKQSGADNLS